MFLKANILIRFCFQSTETIFRTGSGCVNGVAEVTISHLKDDYYDQPDLKTWGPGWYIEYEIDYDSEPAIAAETTDQTFKLKLG